MAAGSLALPASPVPAPVADATLEVTHIQERKLTPQEKKKWEDTMAMMAWTAPGFRHLFYKLLNKDGHDHVAIMDAQATSIAATDGQNIIVNPDTFFRDFGLPERVYVMGHEIIHNVYGDVELLQRCNRSGRVPMHDGTDIEFENEVMQKAMDYRINALLDESHIGTRPKEGHFNDKVKGNDSVLDTYRDAYVEKYGDTKDHGGSQNPGGNPGGFDSLAAPGSASGGNPGQSARNPQQWAVEIAAAQTIEQIRSQGKMSGALKRMFQKILEPEINWTDHIATLINRVCGDGGYDWTRPDPWWAAHEIFSPTPSGRGAGKIVMWGDTSGSRSDQEITSQMAEIAGILADVQPEEIIVLWCDADISYVDRITDPMDLEHIQARGTGGGGGTELGPVMDWIADQPDPPDLFIGFTDGYVGFPEKEPRFPVIWASSTDHHYPWGQVVRVNKRNPNP